MISKSNHPWTNFLYARRVVMEWMRKEMLYDDEQIARSLSMDGVQVKLILMTPVEEE
jgi:hypothetical protein